MVDLCKELPSRKTALLQNMLLIHKNGKFKWKNWQHCHLVAASVRAAGPGATPCLNPAVIKCTLRLCCRLEYWLTHFRGVHV